MKIFTYILVFALALAGPRIFCMATTLANGYPAPEIIQGSKELKPAPTLAAYPNPTRGETIITLSQPGNEVYKIRISNAIGRVVRTIEVPKNSSESQIQVNLAEFPAGFYFYSLLANDKMIETKRLILQH